MRNINVKYIFICFTIGLLTTNCKKDDIPDIPQNSTPVFNAVGTLGDFEVSLHAGKNDVYMHTMVEEFNNLHQYSGELSNGQTALKIQFFPSNVDIPSLYNSFIEKGTYSFAKSFGSEPLLKISKNDFSNANAIEHITWSVDNEEQPNTTLKIYEPGKYVVCASIDFNNGTSGSACNTIIVGYKTHADYELKYGQDANANIEAIIDAPNNQISNISWFINDEFQSNNIHFQTTNAPDQFKLKAKVEFSNGVVGTREVFVNKQNANNSISDFTAIGDKSSLTWDNTILATAKYSGNTFSSTEGSIPTQLDVTEISDYTSNSTGDDVKLISGNLKAPFKYTSSSGDILIGDFKIDFGIAH